MDIRRVVMDQPEGQRLDYALYLLDQMAGSPDLAIEHLRTNYGLTPGEVRVFCALNAASPRVMTREALYTALYAGDCRTNDKIVDVYINKIRAKMGFGTIKTWHGTGFSAPVAMVIPLSDHSRLPSRVNVGRFWTKADDADLVLMVQSRSEVSVIAEEMDRTERGILDRMRLLRQSGQLPS